MQSALLVSFVVCSSIPSCVLQSTHPPMLCYISPYVVVVYNVYDLDTMHDSGHSVEGQWGGALNFHLTLNFRIFSLDYRCTRSDLKKTVDNVF